MFKTIGIFAHVDGGKTTLSEQLLYKNGSIRNLGRVDNQTAFLDYDNIEKERGITVFAEQASFDYNENKYYIIDKDSTNGTKIILSENMEIKLEDKMEFHIGKKKFYI